MHAQEFSLQVRVKVKENAFVLKEAKEKRMEEKKVESGNGRSCV